MIITVFGKNGSGKTTIATHLAKSFADDSKFVVLVSLEARYGSLQRSLCIKIPPEKSILNALTQEDIKPYTTKFEDNIYIVSLADSDDITKYDSISNISSDKKILSNLFEKLKESFDIIIVDASELITDSLTLFSISNADKVINLIESRPEGISFSEAHKVILNKLTEENKVINIINKHDEAIINTSTIASIVGNIDLVIDFNLKVVENERSGTLNKYIFKESNKVMDILTENKSSDNDRKGFLSKIKILPRKE